MNNMVFRFILSIFILLLLVLVLFMFFTKDDGSNGPVDPESTETVFFTVESGMSTEEIIKSLVDQNLIVSGEYAYEEIVANNYIFYENTYGLSPAMTTDEILLILSSPQTNLEEDAFDKLVITEGSNIIQVAESLAAITEYETQEILDFWADPEYLNQLIEEYWFLTDEILNPEILYPLEGYLAPATYPIFDTMTLDEITHDILDATSAAWAPYQDVEYPNGYTLHEIVTLASVIERETITKEDKYLVSGVFYNRIDQGMPLQSDITVLYALGEHKEIVTYADLEVDSPYNTYMYAGLPPGPIANPSVDSVDAAIYPAETTAIYFFATQDTGEVIYSDTYEEHLQVSEENAWE